MKHEGASASSEADEGALAITVNGRLVDGQAYRSNDLSELYVPLRSVAEELERSLPTTWAIGCSTATF
ncbi:hypothetical protein [Paenibacillus cremeus]|uniref:Uncharacterized protein n=1 Tax=Paenibacillus cremeus TaxID=2163881 RepID=A0A559K5F2_9BACL|nr:hypothetical protein [Paenibacillus cremeus]TVY07369.1 hypothetical protein FPZ49_24315 [Paenibacillus cremeus]